MTTASQADALMKLSDQINAMAAKFNIAPAAIAGRLLSTAINMAEDRSKAIAKANLQMVNLRIVEAEGDDE